MNCPYCGHELLEPVAKVCSNCGKVLPESTQGSFSADNYLDSLQADYQTRKGLSDLKNAFLLYFIAAILNLVPVVGIIGGIVNLVGLILLIIGWRTLGRSSLRGSQTYKSSGTWLVYAIIIAIIVGIIGIISITFSAIGFIVSNPSLFQTNSSSTPAKVLQSPSIHQFTFGIFEEILVLVAILLGIWDSVWIKMLFSLKKLGSELSQHRIILAGNLYIIQVVITISGGFVAFLFLLLILQGNQPISTTLTPNLGQEFFLTPYSYFLLGGFWALLELISIAGSVILIVGSYFGYDGLGRVIRKMHAPAPPPPPMQNVSQQSVPGQHNFCPQCGHHIPDQSNNFCPSRGAKLKA